MPSPTRPTPQTWTLRFKSHKTTVLLHVDPLQTFASIKQNLYTALKDTALTNDSTRQPIPLPPSPSDIQLGKPVDPNDATRGFRLGEWEYRSAAADTESKPDKGKGKATTTGSGAGPGRPAKKSDATAAGAAAAAAGKTENCPKGAGLRDGAVLAFRWDGNGSFVKSGEEVLGEEVDEMVDVDLDGGRKGRGNGEGKGRGGGDAGAGDRSGPGAWNVKLAAFEDAYGRNEGDVGGGVVYDE